MRTVRNTELENKSVLLIVDYNTKIVDDRPLTTFKIDQTIDTITYTISQSPACVVISTHLGRPKNDSEYPTTPIYKYLREYFQDLQEHKISEIVESGGDISGKIFTDNLRYYGKETLEKYFSGFDVIINDAFGCSHRNTPFRACAGILMERELQALSGIGKCDLIVIGGAKAADKLKIIEKFDCLVYVGGCVCLAILKCLGYEIGDSPIQEKHDVSVILDRIRFSDEENRAYEADSVVLPVDFVVVTNRGETEVRDYDSIEAMDVCIDIGPRSMKCLEKLVKMGKRIFWNGPIGKFEHARATSTSELIRALSNSKGQVVAGGGETLAAINKYSSVDNFSHVSTGGGALLSYLGGERMPGIDSLE